MEMADENVVEHILYPQDFDRRYRFMLSDKQKLNLEIAKKSKQKIKIRVQYFMHMRYLTDLVVFQ